jgi:hypothetical protein
MIRIAKTTDTEGFSAFTQNLYTELSTAFVEKNMTGS